MIRARAVLGRVRQGIGEPGPARAILAVLCCVLFLPFFANFPVTDRDEALFAVSSRQMAETGDPIRIRYLDEARHKKPVGIYWLQSAAVTLTTGTEARAIWPYRLPSLIAAVVAVLLTHTLALRVTGSVPAFAAGALLAASFVLAGEARLAKTDAVLLAFTLGSMAVLVRAWAGRAETLGYWSLLQFWGCLAGAFLIKGPIGPLVILLTLGTLSLLERNLAWTRPLIRWWGPVVFLLIAAPWYIAITAQEGWAFWQASLVDDLLGKVATAQESHGAPPGAYLLTLPLAFWPGSVLLLLSLPALRKAWPTPALRLALAWIVPFWLILELTPTKLIHYPLPAYPALAILTAALWLDHPDSDNRITRWGAGIVALLGLAIPAAAIGLVWNLEAVVPVVSVLLLGAACISAAALLWQFKLRSPPAVLAALLAMGGLAHVATLSALARPEYLWPTAAIAARLAEAPPCAGQRLFAVGFSEPSLAFLSPMPVRWETGESAAAGVLASPCTWVLVASGQREAFEALAGEGVTLQAEVDGFAVGSGKPVRLALYAPAE